MSKIIASIREALELCHVKDGMTLGFHHHLRDGDMILNMVTEQLALMGVRDITIVMSGLLQGCFPVVEHIKSGVVTGIKTPAIGSLIGKELAKGIMKQPAEMHTHGGLQGAITSGAAPIDIAFVAASAADNKGNMNGVQGKSAFGSMGFAFSLAAYAKKVVVVTDTLMPYPLNPISIDETFVDYVVAVDSIGNPDGIESGIIRVTRDPAGVQIAKYTSDVIVHSGLFRNGMSFQTGGGSISLAANRYLKEKMLQSKITGSFLMGGISAASVEMLEAGCFETILDAQTFSRKAVDSRHHNPRHQEISGSHYANPFLPSCAVESLDIVVLGATEIDCNFNVNVHTDSNGFVMGGSGGHGDTAWGSKLCIIVGPFLRTRLPLVVDELVCTSTPGEYVDVLVTQFGIAVNPRNAELHERLVAAGLPVTDIRKLRKFAVEISGVGEKPSFGDHVVASVKWRDGTTLDEIRNPVV